VLEMRTRMNVFHFKSWRKT